MCDVFVYSGSPSSTPLFPTVRVPQMSLLKGVFAITLDLGIWGLALGVCKVPRDNVDSKYSYFKLN